MCMPDEGVQSGTGARPPKRFGAYVHTEADFATLKRRVGQLEKLVEDLCGALLYSDDMSLLERNTAAIGSVYRDGTFMESREPAFARKRVESVLQAHGVSAKQQPHRWVRLVHLNVSNGTTLQDTSRESKVANSTNTSGTFVTK